jgi:hypothetical protein
MVFSPAVSHLYFLQSEFANGIVCFCCWQLGNGFLPGCFTLVLLAKRICEWHCVLVMLELGNVFRTG